MHRVHTLNSEHIFLKPYESYGLKIRISQNIPGDGPLILQLPRNMQYFQMLLTRSIHLLAHM